MQADLGEQLDKLMNDTKGLSDFLGGLSDRDRLMVFGDLRIRLAKKNETAEKDKLILTPRILQANVDRFTPSHQKTDTYLGLLRFRDQALGVFRDFCLVEDTNYLVYNIHSHPINAADSWKANIGWYWSKGEIPLNVHREVFDQKVTSSGYGEALLTLSEQLFVKLGLPAAKIETHKPATTSYFFHHGYNPIPEGESVFSPEVLEAIIYRESDYGKEWGSDKYLIKDLT